MTNEQQEKLQRLKQGIIAELVGMTDQLADDEDVSYELLLNLARNSDNPDLLFKAFGKIKAIEEPKDKMGALLELLDEAEAQIAINAANSVPTEAAPEAEPQPPIDSTPQNPEQSAQ